MKHITAVGLALIVAILLGGARVSPASAAGTPLTLCNQISVPVLVVVGYHTAGVNDPADHSVLTGPFVTDGWWQIAPKQCSSFANPFSARYMYWWAWSKPFFVNGVINRGVNGDLRAIMANEAAHGFHFCISTPFPFAFPPVNRFTYEDENASMSVCEANVPKRDTNLWVMPHEVDISVSATANIIPE